MLLSVSATCLGFEFNYDNLKITNQVVLEDGSESVLVVSVWIT